MEYKNSVSLKFSGKEYKLVRKNSFLTCGHCPCDVPSHISLTVFSNTSLQT